MAVESKTWITPEAEAAFERWQRARRWSWELDGADPDEVRDDLQNHLAHKAHTLSRPLDCDDLEAALGEIDLPKSVPPLEHPSQARSEATGPFFLGWWLRLLKSRFFLNWLPFLVVVTEVLTGFFGSLVYDPITRWPQAILLLATGGLAVSTPYLSPKYRASRWFPFFLGAGFIPAFYWGLISLAVILNVTVLYGYGVILSFGLALLALPLVLGCIFIAAAPLFAGAGFWRISRDRRGLPWLVGLGAGLFLLLLVEGPAYVTRYGLSQNDAGLVRSWGSQSLLREIALEKIWGPSHEDTSGLVSHFGIVEGIAGGGRREADDLLSRRRFYYRVTGQRPEETSGFFLASRSPGFSGGGFDGGLGGDAVGTTVKNLELSDSRLDGHLDAASGLGYWEWTMEFHNLEQGQKEARMQILLPPGGVVSRLTLWIDGEPQEAAFGARSQVTEAYKSVVHRKRDPVLVRWLANDCVLVQCFPVPARGQMKIRVGMTAPLDEAGRLFLPRLLEQNFAFPSELETAVWVQGDVEMSMENLAGTGQSGQWSETHGTLSQESFTGRHCHLTCHGPVGADLVWTTDPFAGTGNRVLTRERLPDEDAPAPGERSVVLVVDGSAFFESWEDAFRKAVASLRSRGVNVEILFAAEEDVFGEDAPVTFAGGQDNLPALVQGLDLASRNKAERLIWLHGPQPVSLAPNSRFLQLLERSFHQVPLTTVDLVGGPNRLLEALPKTTDVTRAGRPAGPEDLERTLIDLIEQKAPRYRFRATSGDSAPEGVEVWDQLARWRVWDEVREEMQRGEISESLATKAARYQLVTPATAAVVLERASQYQRFNLTQADASTTASIPGIPEPSTNLLLLLASALIWHRQRSRPAKRVIRI